MSEMSIRMRLALSTIATFNALLFAGLGVVSLRFVDGPAAAAGAVALWAAALALVAVSRRLRRPVEWG